MSATIDDLALSEEEQRERAALAYALEDRIKNDLRTGREALWDMTEALFRFHEMDGWRALGYDTQEEWLAQPDIGIKRATYMRAVRRHRDLVERQLLPIAQKSLEPDEDPEHAVEMVKAQLSELDPSKVDLVVATIANPDRKVKLEDILSDIKNLGARDLRQRYYGGPEPPLPSDVIEGEVIPDDETPEEAEAREAREEKRAQEQRVKDEFHKAVLTVDSWFDMGGDRRKAQRAWGKVSRELEAFRLHTVITEFMDGADDSVEKPEAYRAFKEFAGLVGLDLTPAE